MSATAIDAGTVHEVLRRHLLVDGLHLVVDLERSRGVRIRDASSGEEYLDFFGAFSTSALGFNHPGFATAEFLAELVPATVNKLTNSDLYTESLARFVATFATVLPETLQHHLFFIEGGALAVENTLKAAFDWKRRRNLAAGRAAAGSQIIHFRDAFHGRSGYTLSLTNTDPVKIEHFPKFRWPRVGNPALRFPIDERVLDDVRRAEEQSLAEIRAPSPRTRTTSPRSSSSRSRPRAAITTSAPSSCAPCVRSPTRASSCSSSTRCRPASAPPDAGGASSTSASSPT